MTMIPIGPIEEINKTVVVCYQTLEALKGWAIERKWVIEKGQDLVTMNGDRIQSTCFTYTLNNTTTVFEEFFLYHSIPYGNVHDFAGINIQGLWMVDGALPAKDLNYLMSRIRSTT